MPDVSTEKPKPIVPYPWPEVLLSTLPPTILTLSLIYVLVGALPHATAIQSITIYGSIALTILLLATKQIRLNLQAPLSSEVLLFFGWACLSILWSLDRSNTLHDLRSHFFVQVALFVLAVHFINSKAKFLLLVWAQAASAIILSCWLLWLFYIKANQPYTAKLVTLLPYTHVNRIGYIAIPAMAILIAFCFDQRQKIKWRFLALLSSTPLFAISLATQSRAAYIALAICLFFLFGKRVWFTIPLLICITLATFNSPVIGKFKNKQNRSLNAPRVAILLTDLEIIKDYPLLGIGFGHEILGNKVQPHKYRENLPQKYRIHHTSKNGNYRDPHCHPMAIFIMLGAVGFALYLIILCRFIWLCIKLIRHSNQAWLASYARALLGGFLAFNFMSLFEAASAFSPQITFFTMLAQGAILKKLYDQDTGSPDTNRTSITS